MSHEWIFANIRRAVEEDVADLIRRMRQHVYSRHLFFSPLFHPCAAKHAEARAASAPEIDHRDHEAIHYSDAEVKASVNMRKASLRTRHGPLPSLTHET